jgi:hypothetical protein
MTVLTIPDADERGDLGAFVGRVVRLDQTATVRLVCAGGTVTVWAGTPFEVLATRSVHGTLDSGEVTTPASVLLAALAVARSHDIDPGAGGVWAGVLPPSDGWTPVDDVPATELERLTERGLVVARENAGPMGPPAALLDQTVLTVANTSGGATAVKVPLRCLFALSGMGFLGAGSEGDTVRVSATGSWMRLDARFGAVVRRRVTALPLLAL